MARKGQKYTGKELENLNKRKNLYYEKLYLKIVQDYKKGIPLYKIAYKYHTHCKTINKAISYCEGGIKC